MPVNGADPRPRRGVRAAVAVLIAVAAAAIALREVDTVARIGRELIVPVLKIIGFDPCAHGLTAPDGWLVYRSCAEDEPEARALIARLRSGGIEAKLQPGDGGIGVVYRPIDKETATKKAAAVVKRRSGKQEPLVREAVYFDLDLESWTWRLDPACPEGWEALPDVTVTSYVLALEEDFPDTELTLDPCGLPGAYRTGFLFGDGVKMQGSGRTLDGRYVHYQGNDCFAVTECAKTATGRCAEPGRTAAVDPTVMPLGSSLLVERLGKRVAEDVGGFVKGKHVDIYWGDTLSPDRIPRSGEPRMVCWKPPRPRVTPSR
jgi:3D (Asp-Asp-Asp) domain-containing protein